MIQVISKVIPILLLVCFGYIIQIRQMADKDTMDNVKKAIIKVALPAVLFLTFKDMDIKSDLLVMTIIVFLLLCLFLLVGFGLNRILPFKQPILPFIMSGYSFGLLGIPLFTAVYGIENLSVLLVFGIGHEFFVWFVYLTLVQQKLGGHKFSIETITNFFKSPLIIAIISGLAINLLDLSRFFESNIFLVGIENTLKYISSTATPVILLIIGYGIKIEKEYLHISVKLVALRLMVTMIIGYLVKFLVIDRIFLDPSPLFQVAFFTFLIMPPPFSFSIFVGEYNTEENAVIAANTTVLSTLVSIGCFLAASVFLFQ